MVSNGLGIKHTIGFNTYYTQYVLIVQGNHLGQINR
jgi:hypothetical protein